MSSYRNFHAVREAAKLTLLKSVDAINVSKESNSFSTSFYMRNVSNSLEWIQIASNSLNIESNNLAHLYFINISIIM